MALHLGFFENLQVLVATLRTIWGQISSFEIERFEKFINFQPFNLWASALCSLVEIIFLKYNPAMTRVEDLAGIHGTFEGEVKPHPRGFQMRAVADGTLTYQRDKEVGKVTINVQGLSVRTVPGDYRRFVRITRGPKGDRDKIIGLVDTD